jgi:LytR cell envelope-related transcriptional attenuator
VLVLGGLLILAAAVLIAKSVGGSSGTKNAATSSASTAAGSHATRHSKHAKPSANAPAATTNPAETVVDVLNGTNTTGLAHRVAGDLQRSGYSQATALAGRPSGSNQVTVVQYASGHQGDAQAVSHSISTTQVQPLEGSVAALAPSASVVVIVGADRASAAGGEESAGGGATAVP